MSDRLIRCLNYHQIPLEYLQIIQDIENKTKTRFSLIPKYRYEELYPCMDCEIDTGYEVAYMIDHNLWRDILNLDRGFLCLDCLEKRLGRKLKLSDFPEELRINTPIYFGYQLHKNEEDIPGTCSNKKQHENIKWKPKKIKPKIETQEERLSKYSKLINLPQEYHKPIKEIEEITGKIYRPTYPQDICIDCKEKEPLPRFKKETLLEAIGVQKALICPICLEKRLGRKLTIEDIKNIPYNSGIYFGHQLRCQET